MTPDKLKARFDTAWDTLADHIPEDTKICLADGIVLKAVRDHAKAGIDELAAQIPSAGSLAASMAATNANRVLPHPASTTATEAIQATLIEYDRPSNPNNAARAGYEAAHKLLLLQQGQATPSSRWKAEGEPDPHNPHYDGERTTLVLGKLTDDELANAAFMHYNSRMPPLEDIIAGKAYSPICYMTAVKDRIRWLSRALEASEAKVRAKVVAELKASAFMHCDVNKEDVLLCIQHGTTLIEARKLEGEKPNDN